MMTIARRVVAKVKGILSKCYAEIEMIVWQGKTDSRQSSPIDEDSKTEGIRLSRSEMLFVKGLIEAEHQRLWKDKYYPLARTLKAGIEDITIEYQKVIAEQPDSPEAFCFNLLDRINRLEYKRSMKEKNV